MVLIFDEVISGFRAALGGAQALYRVKPDLTCLGKIIGGGLPVGAYGGRRELMELVAPVGPVYQAGTLSGNPLAMAAGLWSLGQLSKGLYTRLSRLGGMLAAGLADAARSAGVPLHVNAFGSVLTPFFTTEPVRDYRSAVNADARQYAVFVHAMPSNEVRRVRKPVQQPRRTSRPTSGNWSGSAPMRSTVRENSRTNSSPSCGSSCAYQARCLSTSTSAQCRTTT